jgi:hypothetical protein
MGSRISPLKKRTGRLEYSPQGPVGLVVACEDDDDDGGEVPDDELEDELELELDELELDDDELELEDEELESDEDEVEELDCDEPLD